MQPQPASKSEWVTPVLTDLNDFDMTESGRTVTFSPFERTFRERVIPPFHTNNSGSVPGYYVTHFYGPGTT